MQWYDWLIVLLPTIFVYYIGLRSRRYLKDVSTFLSAGRVCGRYVIGVADVASSLSVTGLMAYVEVHYRTGFATAFWYSILMPITVIMSLFGYVFYRFRETRAQSIGQFLEMRYSRSFRIFAAALRSISEMLANMIMPALAARFFIYFLGLPKNFTFCGIEFSTFQVLIFVVLLMAISIICMGGAMSIIITDTIQGFICYPTIVIFVIFVLMRFDWNDQILPILSNRADGESFLDPLDIENLRDFNVFAFLVLPIISLFLQRASWIGAGSSTTAARSPHEQKMASLIGTWRAALGGIFYVLIAVAILTFLNHSHFASEAHSMRLQLSDQVATEVLPDPATRSAVMNKLNGMNTQYMAKDAVFSDKENLDSRYLNTAHNELKNTVGIDSGNALFAKFRTLYYQLLLPIGLRNMLPPGMMGLFCLLMILLMVSTDDTRIFSAAITVSQDVILPLRKKQLTPREHMWMVRWVTIGIGVFFFIGSAYMAQLDYINLFVTLMCTMWSGGCGPVLIFGLYSRFGTTAGAWTSLLTGMFMGFVGIFFQRNWADMIYPFLRKHEMVESVGKVLETLSGPFEPWIVWRMNEVRCPINSYEWSFICQTLTLLLYIGVSYLTCKEKFNLDRMLHRGKYDVEGKGEIKSPWKWSNFYNKFIGITPEYTTGDKVIAWSYFVYSFIYRFGCTFLLAAVWNLISPWPEQYWGLYFLIVFLVVPGIMAGITAVWFGIGGTFDLIRMFKDLESRQANMLDDGRVEGNVSLADKAHVATVEDKQDKQDK